VSLKCKYWVGYCNAPKDWRSTGAVHVCIDYHTDGSSEHALRWWCFKPEGGTLDQILFGERWTDEEE
jgi:hypothetical protein